MVPIMGNAGVTGKCMVIESTLRCCKITHSVCRRDQTGNWQASSW